MKLSRLIFLFTIHVILQLVYNLKSKTKTKTSTATNSSTISTNGLFASFKMHNEIKNQLKSQYLSSLNSLNAKNRIKATNANSNKGKILKKQEPLVLPTPHEDIITRMSAENPDLLDIQSPNKGFTANQGALGLTKNLNFAKNKNLMQENIHNTIYWSGWVKFFKYNNNKVNKASNFFKNQEYIKQFKKNINLNSSDKTFNGEYINIPNEISFYANLFRKSVTISKMKNDKGGFSNVFDVLNLKFIDNVIESSSIKTGGIEDFGYHKEGNCFRINTHIAGQHIIWIFCLDEVTQKNAFMNNLKQLKIEMQREKGIYSLPQPSIPKKLDTVDSILGKKEIKDIDVNRRKGFEGDLAIDGYWQILQDWSQCDLKCGGGTSTLQRICIPPKGNGKPCDGAQILTRKCNIQPCQNNIINQHKSNNSTIIEETKPIIKVLPFSDKPQKYDVSLNVL